MLDTITLYQGSLSSSYVFAKNYQTMIDGFAFEIYPALRLQADLGTECDIFTVTLRASPAGNFTPQWMSTDCPQPVPFTKLVGIPPFMDALLIHTLEVCHLGNSKCSPINFKFGTLTRIWLTVGSFVLHLLTRTIVSSATGARSS